MQKRFADSAWIAVLFASGACVALSAIAVYNDIRKDTLDAASYATLWIVCWPLTFASGLWYDVRRGAARQAFAPVTRSGR